MEQFITKQDGETREGCHWAISLYAEILDPQSWQDGPATLSGLTQPRGWLDSKKDINLVATQWIELSKFIKGLTGRAQIMDKSGPNPDGTWRYDIELSGKPGGCLGEKSERALAVAKAEIEGRAE